MIDPGMKSSLFFGMDFMSHHVFMWKNFVGSECVCGGGSEEEEEAEEESGEDEEEEASLSSIPPDKFEIFK